MVTDQCERKHSRAFRIRCTDIKESPFLQALIFAGRNWHFTGLQDQRGGSLIPRCPSVYVGKHVRHTNGDGVNESS